MLTAGLCGFPHGFLSLLFGAHEEHLRALAGHVAEKVTGVVQLSDALAQVDNMDSVARVENERLHFRVPALGLMSEMDTGFEKFFYTNILHSFPFVGSPRVFPADHLAERRDSVHCCCGHPVSHEIRNSWPFPQEIA